MAENNVYDVAVIGAGPAGIMACLRAAELGAKTVLIEKNPVLGKKLLLTGKGRCNLMPAVYNHKKLASAFGKKGGFLLSGFSVFGPRETKDFFEKRGVKLKQERGKRIFPKSDRAEDVLNCLIEGLIQNKAEVALKCEVKSFKLENGKIAALVLKNKKQIRAKNYIIATGGKSYPSTGSNGSGYFWLKKMGHTIVKPRPALVPLKIKEKWCCQAQGLGLKNAAISVWQNQKKKDEAFGEALFTHFGLSGPIILEMSKKIGKLLERGEVKLKIDLKPALDPGQLDKRLQRDFLKYQNKMFKNSLDDLLPQKLIPAFVKLSGINPSKKTNSITRAERQKIGALLKEIEITVEDLMGFDMAIVTSGGVSLKEIEGRTMKSKIIENLYLAGEVIDLDGPSGGYNLQLCWTTGYLAGQSAQSA